MKLHDIYTFHSTFGIASFSIELRHHKFGMQNFIIGFCIFSKPGKCINCGKSAQWKRANSIILKSAFIIRKVIKNQWNKLEMSAQIVRMNRSSFSIALLSLGPLSPSFFISCFLSVSFYIFFFLSSLLLKPYLLSPLISTTEEKMPISANRKSFIQLSSDNSNGVRFLSRIFCRTPFIGIFFCLFSSIIPFTMAFCYPH